MIKLSVIDLFAGIAGFSLGLHRTGGYETVKFCEMKPHAQRVLAKNFPGVPCHDDVTTYEFKRGEADVITAGFPCQDISFAGDGAGLAGARSELYREVIRAIRVVRPLYAILESVAALLSRGLDVVLGDMAEIGYDAEWHCIPASAVGAPNRRDRIWIIADAGGEQYESSRAPFSGSLAAQLSSPILANAYGWDAECRSGKRPGLCEPEAGEGADDYPSGRSALVADAAGERCDEAWGVRCEQPEEWIAGCGKEMADTQGIGWGEGFAHRGRCGEGSGEEQITGSAGCGWWSVEPDVGRVAHGVPMRVDRLAELGNAVVPQIPEIIGRAILQARAA
jgi:DNA (cytosine-5)-methyltransferase 1